MRTVMVTGAGGAMGAAICHRLAATGHTVWAADLNLPAVQAVVAGLEGTTHRALRLDVTSESSVRAAFAERGADGPLYGLVCTAGGTRYTRQERPATVELDLDHWRWTFALNVEGAFLCAREYLRTRGERRDPGRIVLFSSTAGQMGGRSAGPAYGAAKSAVIGLGRALASEQAGRGVTVNTIAPGPFDTPAFHATNGPEDTAVILQKTPAGRLGKPVEVAETVCFLLHDNAAFITGAVIDVNGGTRMG